MSAISNEIKQKVRIKAKHRCGYCLLPQEILSIPLEIEHILPISSGGTDEKENLWLACRNCNGFKFTKTEAEDPKTGKVVVIFNPRTQIWREHF